MKNYLLGTFSLISSVVYSQTGTNTSLTFNSGGTTRNYTIYVPLKYDGLTPVPLVFNIHGFLGSDTQQEQYGDFRTIADTENFIVVHPKALGSSPSWNVFGTLASGAADRLFIMSLLDSVMAHYNINQKRVYSTGYSQGGFMSQDLACQYSTRFAAIASVCGGMVQSHYSACNPQHPTPFMEIHGTSDQIISYTGTGGLQNCMPVDTIVKYWYKYDACNTTPVVTSLPNINAADNCTVTHYVYAGANSDSRVELYKVISGGHQWPATGPTGGATGTGNRNADFSASKEIWRFFNEHTLSTGIENYETDNNTILIYPNPSNGIFIIELKNIQNADFVIYNILGEVVYSEKNLNQISTIHIGNVPAGVYFYQVNNQTGLIKTGKLIME